MWQSSSRPKDRQKPISGTWTIGTSARFHSHAKGMAKTKSQMAFMTKAPALKRPMTAITAWVNFVFWACLAKVDTNSSSFGVV